jgi:hypothetical protein
MVGSGEVQGNFHGREYLSPQFAEKNPVPVCDDDSRRPMELQNIVYEQLSNLLNSIWVSHRKEMSIFGQSVNYH